MNREMFPNGVAVVFGATGGLGSVICKSMAEAGANVAFTYRTESDTVKNIEAESKSFGRKVMPIRADVSNEDDIVNALKEANDSFGRIHSIIYAVGADLHMQYVADTDPQRFRDAISNDIFGFFYVAQAALPLLRDRGGAIVALSTAALTRYSPKDILSTGPKAGVEAISQAIAFEEGRHGIRSNTVGVGAVNAGVTERVFKQLSPAHVEAMAKACPLKRLGEAQEVADTVTFLASNRSSFITGQHINVDGGFTA